MKWKEACDGPGGGKIAKKGEASCSENGFAAELNNTNEETKPVCVRVGKRGAYAESGSPAIGTRDHEGEGHRGRRKRSPLVA